MTFHMHFSVRNALKLSRREFHRRWKGCFTRDDGTPMTDDEAIDALLDELSKGHELIPLGHCDNFDYKEKGCLGHGHP